MGKGRGRGDSSGEVGVGSRRSLAQFRGHLMTVQIKADFLMPKKKPVEKSRMPVFPSEFDYICIWVFLKGGSEEERTRDLKI